MGNNTKKTKLSIVTIYNDNHSSELKNMLASCPSWCEIILAKVDINKPSAKLADLSLGGIIESNYTEKDNIKFVEYGYRTKEYCIDGFFIPIIDFSLLRNKAKTLATGDWILSLDADEMLVGDQLDAFMQELENVPKEYDGFTVPIINQKPVFAKNGVISRSIDLDVRLFRNKEYIKFQNPIHEGVYDSIIDNGGKVADTTFTIYHSGYEASKAAMKKKIIRNMCILWSNPELMKQKKFIKYMQGTAGMLNKIDNIN